MAMLSSMSLLILHSICVAPSPPFECTSCPGHRCQIRPRSPLFSLLLLLPFRRSSAAGSTSRCGRSGAPHKRLRRRLPWEAAVSCSPRLADKMTGSPFWLRQSYAVSTGLKVTWRPMSNTLDTGLMYCMNCSDFIFHQHFLCWMCPLLL